MRRSPYHHPHDLIGGEEVWPQVGGDVSEGQHLRPEPNFEEILKDSCVQISKGESSFHGVKLKELRRSPREDHGYIRAENPMII